VALEDVKEKLLENPEAIVNILDAFDFHKIKLRSNEIRCAFQEDMNPTAIVIRLKDNENLFVKDYERSMYYDLINYIIKAKGYEFKEVINAIKKELGISNIYNFKKKVGLFGGLYDKISKQDDSIDVQTYSEELLTQYHQLPNIRFLKDNISLETQKKYQIGYDILSQRITIPIRTPYGDLAGIKGRCNYTPDEFEPKYLYIIPAPMSQLLYGYYENYNELIGGDIKIFESEKSVLTLDSMGMHDGVALGSNSISPTQAKLIMSLNPRSVTFLLDEGLPIENTMRNIEILKAFCKLKDVTIRYFDTENTLLLPSKAAPVDCGIETYDYILQNELITVGEDEI
jgi:DNA primase